PGNHAEGELLRAAAIRTPRLGSAGRDPNCLAAAMVVTRGTPETVIAEHLGNRDRQAPWSAFHAQHVVPVTIVFYISGHGLGHASRSIELLKALAARRPDARL